MSWLDQSAIRSSIGAEGSATLCFFGPPIHFLGGSHCFYPLKEREKKKQRLGDHTVHMSSCAEQRMWQFKHRAVRCAGLCKGCAVVPWWRFAQWSLTEAGMSEGIRGIIQHFGLSVLQLLLKLRLFSFLI